MATSDELEAQIQALKDQLKEARETFEPVQQLQNELSAEAMRLQEEYTEELNKMRAAFREKEEALAKKRQEVNEKSWTAHRKVSDIQAALEKAARDAEAMRAAELEAIRQKEIAAKQAEQNAALTSMFDKATLGAKWREWAKDHQINGARKLVEDRRVILADPMGLGKTLTSIITVEMAERLTKDASSEFPFLGEEKQVKSPDMWFRKSDGQKYMFKTSDIIENPDDYDFVPSKVETQIVNAVTRPVGRRVLYLCPNALIRNVMDEWRMWAPHRNVTFIGGMSRAERQFAFEHVLPNIDNFVVICNFEAWRRDKLLIDKLIEFKFDTIIIDEAHNAKDRKSQVWKGIAELIGLPEAKSSYRPEYILPMTGTPVLNRPQELFTLLNMVDPGNFYHENDFLYSYCEQDWGTGFYSFKPGGMELLANKLGKIFLRRTKDQAGIVLPEKTIIHHDLDIDEDEYPRQAKARQHMREFATVVVENSVDQYGQPKSLSAAAVIAMYTRLRQIETWPAGIVQYKTYTDPVTGKSTKTDEILLQLDVEESQKVDYIIKKADNHYEGLLLDVIEDERVVLFSQFKAPLRELEQRINAAGYRAVILDGDTPQDTKDEIRRDFDQRHTPDRANSKWDVVLCNYRVGGVGLNLTAASQMIILDEEWNPGKRDQAYDRIHRIGQEKSVTIHVIRMNKTIDDWLAGIMENKENLVEGFNKITGGNSLKDALDSGLI